MPTSDNEDRHLAAVCQERLVRAAACLRLTETVGSFELLPMTLRQYTALRLMASPYLSGQTPMPEETVAFLWLLSPDYNPENKRGRQQLEERCWSFFPPLEPLFRTRRAMRKYDKACDLALFEHARIVNAIREYMVETLQDSPPAVQREGIPAPEYYCDEISICCTLAREFGGGLDAYPHLPLKLLFQALKEVQEVAYLKAGKTPVMLNHSDAEVDRELLEANLELKRQREAGQTANRN